MRLARRMQQAAAGVPVADTGWSLSDVTYNGSPQNSFSVEPQDLIPSDVFFKPDGTKMYVVGNGGNKVIEYDLSSAWEVSSASYVQNFNVGAQDGIPEGVFFKPDGTKMYVVGDNNNAVYEYDLSSAWDISTASYLQNFNVVSEESSPSGVFFKPDGTKMYVIGFQGDEVNEYDLSSAWDVSTASYLQTFSVAAQDTLPEGVFFKPDGTKMYVVGNAGNDINEYDLSSAWDISTASYLQVFNVSLYDNFPQGIFFKPDGTKMYVVGTQSLNVWQYDLSTAWDISTASFTYPSTEYFDVSPQELSPEGVFFKPDGTKMYVVGDTGNDIGEYDLSSAWDISTASYLQNLSLVGQDLQPSGLFFKPDGTKLYFTGNQINDVNEYDLSSAWDISTASFVQDFSVGTEETEPEGIFFKPDGTKMYVVGRNGDDVNEYDLSSAWDISTASYLQNFSVSGQSLNPQAVFFKPDGTKMYVTSGTAANVSEYDLSTAWDISSASPIQSFSVRGQDIDPTGLFFKPDGTKMYIAGNSSNAIWSYDLYIPPTPPAPSWTDPDLANASYDSVSFSVAGQETIPTGIFFKDDGLSLFVIGNNTDSVFQYTLTTAWDISTASYASKSFSVASQETAPNGIAFSDDGLSFYAIGSSSDSVNQYTLSTAWDISTASYASKSFSVASQDGLPTGMAFSYDGTKFYISGFASDTLYQYNLSTAWDVSTASYSSNSFNIATIDGSTRGLYVAPTGNKLWFMGLEADIVFELDLSTAFDLSTAAYNSVSFSVTSQDSTPLDMFFKADGSKMYVIGITTDTIYQYSTA
jgi:DNA-binding beta-propeller fold protein YncE